MTFPSFDEREALVRAAYRLLAQNPGRVVTLQELLDESGLSTRAFYRHFASKDQLLVAIYQRDAQRVAEERVARVAAVADPYRQLLAWIDHWIAIAYEARRSGRIRVLSSAQFLAAEGVREAIRESADASRSVIRDIIAAGVEAGVFRTASPALDARALQAAVDAIVRDRLDGTLATSPSATFRGVVGFAERILELSENCG